jgi:transcription-repair coupling factor (superfamily II helicase)
MNSKNYVESTHTRLEGLFERAFETKKKKVSLTGCSSGLGLGFFLSQTNSKTINDLPHFVVVADKTQALRLLQTLEFFDPHRQVEILPGFDVSVYSGLYPGPRVVHDRLRFLAKACDAKPGQIFVTSCSGLMQKTIPESVFIDSMFTIKAGDEITPELARKLETLGYVSAPLVEDVGQFAIRGGIIDIFSPAEKYPIRIELFGDEVTSLRSFNQQDQRSIDPVQTLSVIPAREILFLEEYLEELISQTRASLSNRHVDSFEADELMRSLIQKNYIPGAEFLLPFFYPKLSHVLDYFAGGLNVWLLDAPEVQQVVDQNQEGLKKEFLDSESSLFRPHPDLLFQKPDELIWPKDSRVIEFSSLTSVNVESHFDAELEFKAKGLEDFSSLVTSSPFGSQAWLSSVKAKLSQWRDQHFRIFIALKNASSLEKLRLALEKLDFLPIKVAPTEYLWDEWLIKQDHDPRVITLIPRTLPESQRFDDDRIIFLREDDFFGRKERSRSVSAYEDFQKQARRLNFGDLKPGDYAVHVKHGIGLYEGLKIMMIDGAESEFIQLSYKDKARLYLPVYRVGQLQKYSGGTTNVTPDKLGGVAWERTKIKVKAHLKDIASELLVLYAKRAEIQRNPFKFFEDDILLFEKGFPYDETDDQLRAIDDIFKDLRSHRPMDRLICGDVGFGKTEVAMRAAFLATHNGKQVAVLAPTTILTFQHWETFKKRFEGWNVNVQVINRFVSSPEAKKILADLREGKVDILIGTHRLLSKDVQFKNLGLLVVDEEQKFGVTHKEKIKKMRVDIDTLTLSATPIPRTLNMSLVGIRDLSLINTAPVDRLPTRTFICKFDPETIRKAILSEIQRGGQIYFIHNRVQSIHGLADEIRQIVPTARLRIAHGQMDEEQLEKTMLEFFHHEIDILVCTAIVESGMDVPRANTMFIDQAQLFGISQLYQLRGRVGRSKQRAYCYLILPRHRKLDKEAIERLKVIQDNTALGSGIKIAQYDLELRGAGNILSDDQSGHIDSVGYELYMDLLQEALADAKGQPHEDFELDPEVNLRIPALIPDSYIADIRLRLSYYKALADITSESELERIEEELKDQFGEIPDPVLNLMGLMLIRRQCKDLGVRDISAGLKNISLIFTEQTKLKPEVVIQLAVRENKKYSITPDHRLNVRMNSITWSNVYEELGQLLKLV